MPTSSKPRHREWLYVPNRVLKELGERMEVAIDATPGYL